MTELQRIKNRIEILEENLGQGDDLIFTMAVRLRLTRYESALLALLLKREAVSYKAAHAVLYGDDVRGSSTVHVHLCNLRKKLKPGGVVIDSLWGVGALLTPENKQKIREVLGIGSEASKPQSHAPLAQRLNRG